MYSPPAMTDATQTAAELAELRQLRDELRDLQLRHELHQLRNDFTQFKETVMATQAEQAQTLRDVLAQQKKTATEIAGVQAQTETLKEKIDSLQAIIDAGTGTAGEATQELIDAVAAVKAQAQVLDDAIPDAVVPPTP